MPEERPRPQYGEYASPQDQARAIAGSLPPVPPSLRPPARPNDPSETAAQQEPTAQRERVAPAGGFEVDEDVSQERFGATHAPTTEPPRRAPAPASPRQGDGARARDVRRPRTWDRVLSIALLAYGFVTVIGGVTRYPDLGSLLDEVFALQGIGDFTSMDFASSMGRVLAVVNVVLWAVAVLITVRMLQARRIAFWVPLVAGVLAAIVTAVLLAVVIFADPAFSAYVRTGGG